MNLLHVLSTYPITPNTPTHTTRIVTAKPEKSVIAAFFLTFIFGPLGLLYATVGGGIFLIICAMIIVPLTGGLAIILLWPASMIWAVIAAMVSKSGTETTG